MKTAVSIPDELFQQAEKLAAELDLTRSAFYAQALHAMIERLKDEAVTAAMNAALADEPDTIDPFMVRAARRTMKRMGD